GGVHAHQRYARSRRQVVADRGARAAGREGVQRAAQAGRARRRLDDDVVAALGLGRCARAELGGDRLPNTIAIDVVDGLRARQRVQVPHDTAHGTTTVCPTPTRATSAPTAMIWATHSWPMATGPLNGTLPQMQRTTGSTSRSAMPACKARETGRWIGSVSPSQ